MNTLLAKILQELERQLAAGFRPLAREVQGIVADVGDRPLTYADLSRLHVALQAVVETALLGKARDPFGGLLGDVLLQQIDNATAVAIAAQTAALTTAMEQAGPAVWARLRADRAAGAVQSVFGPVPALVVEEARTWADPRGYRLSDRIWGCAKAVRDDIDRVLLQGVSTGRSAIDVARDLVPSLITPGRTTTKPYGEGIQGQVNYNALRLARTEIARAFNDATDRAAQRNPLVEQLRVRLSGSHPQPDVCDTKAGIFPKAAAPFPPFHPHCLCTLMAVEVDIDQAVDRLIAWADGAEDPELDLLIPEETS